MTLELLLLLEDLPCSPVRWNRMNVVRDIHCAAASDSALRDDFLLLTHCTIERWPMNTVSV
jgi:hypothetical protein